VAVGVDGQSDRLHVTLTWAGGHTSEHEVVRPVQRYEQSADLPRLLARIRELHGAGLSMARIAERLNAEGHRPLKGPERFHGDLVGRILLRRTPQREVRSLRGRDRLQNDEWLSLTKTVWSKPPAG
jgi:hypothetical protein